VEARSWSVSRAGEGKNESSAGKRVIVAKGSRGQQRAAEGSRGQGRAGRKGTMPLAVDIGELQLGGRYNGSMWATRNNQVLLSESHGDGGRRWDATAVRI
jgi:hypothetical protein